MKLTRKDVKAIWNIDWDTDFHEMKQNLTTTPILTSYKQWRAYTMYIGISRIGFENALVGNDVVTTYCAAQ